MSAIPPLDGHSGPIRCSRALAGPVAAPTRRCEETATWHIIWTSDGRNGLCCDEHYQEARERWGFYAAHAYEMTCSMPGAVFLEAENRCVVDEESLGLRELVAAAAVGEPTPATGEPQ